MYENIMDQFSAEDRVKLVEHRPMGRPNSEYTELYARRDQAVVELFLEISAERPQTKRHAYYKCKAIGLCGVDHGKKTYHSDIIASIINDACWNRLISFDSVLDNSRTLNVPMFWEDARDRVQSAKDNFTIDLGVGQRTRIIVCTEKDAVIDSVYDVCQREHIPSMSFHGQCSDGAIHKLAKQIAIWRCDQVQIAYLGDFDPAGLVINDVVFGRNGKLQRMLDLFFPGSPRTYGTRIGITAEDLDNSGYTEFILPAHREKVFFPTFSELRGGDDRTLGIDILSTEEIEARLESFIARFKDQAAWKRRERVLRAEIKNLDKMILAI